MLHQFELVYSFFTLNVKLLRIQDEFHTHHIDQYFTFISFNFLFEILNYQVQKQ